MIPYKGDYDPGSSEDGKFSEGKKMATHGDMGRQDEEDIEVCSRSIDLWGEAFILYYNVACQAFFSFFSVALKFFYHFPPLNEAGDVIYSVLINGHCCLQFIDDRVIPIQRLLCHR